MRWLRTFEQRPGGGGQLVCFPYGGGSATAYRDWPAGLPGVRLSGVQYPGRGDRFTEPLVDDVTMAARQLLPEVVALPGRPLALFGHSLGAYLAYETALLMDAAGRPADLLIVSGVRAPHDPARMQDHCAELPDDAFVRAVGGLGGTDAEVLADRDLREVLLPILRNDYRAAETYQPSSASQLSCPLVCFVGDSDPVTDPREVWRWGELSAAGFTSRVFPGGHFFPVGCRADLVRTIAQQLIGQESRT
jgi:surfactin synthase thioesterase subunit